MKALIAFLILTASFVVSAAGAPAQEAQQATDSAADEGDKYWGTECTGPRRDASALTCTATQSIFVAETQQLLFGVKVVTPAGGGEPVMELQGPLNFYLPAGIGLSVDGTELAKIAVSNCNQSGCYGAIKLEVAMIETLKRGAT